MTEQELVDKLAKVNMKTLFKKTPKHLEDVEEAVGEVIGHDVIFTSDEVIILVADEEFTIPLPSDIDTALKGWKL